MRLPLALLAALTLTACEEGLNPLIDPNLEEAELRREFLTPVVPFDGGVLSVVAAERGEMRTYLFYPCRNGARICAGSAHGPAVGIGDLDQDGVVTFTSGGRLFRLERGGTGTLVRHGAESPLAWE